MGRSNGLHWFYAYVPQGVAGGATSALIPLFAYGLGGNLSDIGIIAAATSVASVPAFILWGSLSDRIGRRKMFLLIGFLGNAISFLLMALSRTMTDFYSVNLLIGFLGAASAPVATVLIMESSERSEWPSRLALLSRIGAIGWVTGLALGVAWLAIGPGIVGAELSAMRGLFVIGSALGFLSVFLAMAWTREPERRVDRHEVGLLDLHPRIERGRFLPFRRLHYFDPSRPRTRRLPRPLRVYLLTVLLLFAGFTAFYAFFPIFLREAVGLPSPMIFAVYIASQVSSVVFYPRVARMISAKGSRPLQIYASLGRAALFPSFFLLGFAPLPPIAWLLAAVALHAGVGVCWAVINVTGSTMVSRLAPEQGRAQALGAYNAIQGIGAILGPLAGGFTAEFLGYGPAFAVSVALILAGCGVLALSRAGDGESPYEKSK